MLGNFIVFLLMTIGMTHIIIDGSIFNTPRNWIFSKNIKWLNELLSCYMCVSTHVSWFLCIFVWNPLSLPWYQSIIVCAFAGSFASVLGASLINFLNIPYGQNDGK